MTHPRIVHEAKEFAGVFYDQDRSALFRSMWPSQDEYVKFKWPHFVPAVRQAWSAGLADENVPQKVKDYFYETLIADAAENQSERAISPIPIFPNTQQFKGDPYENRQTAKNIGNGSDVHKHLMTTATKFKVG